MVEVRRRALGSLGDGGKAHQSENANREELEDETLLREKVVCEN